jgi:hypothetical protein
MPTVHQDLLMLTPKDLSGPEAAWANRKYHGHRTLPPDVAADLKNSYKEYLTKLEALNPVPSK